MRLQDSVVLSTLMHEWHLDEELRKIGYSRPAIEIILHLYSKRESSAPLYEIQASWAYWGEFGQEELLTLIRSLADVQLRGSASPRDWGSSSLVLRDRTQKALDQMTRPILEREGLSPPGWREEVFLRAVKSLAELLPKQMKKT